MNLKIKKYFLLLIICFLNVILSKVVFALTDEGQWKPQIVEKMYILPPKQLNRVLENDFKSSSLAAILNNKDKKIKNRHLKITNLNEAVLGFEGEEKIELQHQLMSTIMNSMLVAVGGSGELLKNFILIGTTRPCIEEK